MSGGWGQYSNPPSRESAEMQECRRLHNLWPKSELALPLTFKGEASMEFVDWYFQAAWDEAVAQSHLQKQFPSREQWLVMKGQDLKDIAEKFGLSKGGKKLDIYSRIMEHILQELPSNIYLPLAELEERIPIFPYSLDSDQLAKLYVNSQTASKPIRDMIKHTYFTPETFKQLLKWEEKFEGGILDQDKDGCILLGRYFAYYLVMNPHFDLNLLLLRDPAVLSDQHNILTTQGLTGSLLDKSNSLRGQLLGENGLMGDNEVLGMSNLLSHNQLLTFDLLQGLFGIFLPSSLGHPSGLDLTATSAMNRGWRESLVQNPCVPTSLIRLLCDHEPDLLDLALQNPNLSSAFIIDLWENLSHSQLEELLTHNSFIPRELIHSLFEKGKKNGKGGNWKGYALSDAGGATSIVQNCLGQYHFPMWVLKGLKPYNDPDYFTADHLWTDERTLDAERLGLNPNPEILEYALEHFSVFLEGGSPRYTIAQNPSLSIELLKKYYADFDADDVARNPALTLDFIKAYYQNPTIEGVQKAGLHKHISELTANSAIFPYDPTPEWASGLFNWRF